MRILRVVSDLYPNVVGGLGLHAHELSKEQAKLGHDVTVMTTAPNGKTGIEYRDGYRVIYLRPLCRPFANSIIPSLLMKVTDEKEKYDIIHAHSHLFFSTNICALIRKFNHPPLVITNHGVISTNAPIGLQSIYMNTVARWTYEAADRIICYTEEDKAALAQYGVSAEKISTIHNGINTEKFSFIKGYEKKNQILWAGRFVSGKGLEYLIDAFSLLTTDFPKLRLVLVGTGPTKEMIMDRVRKLNLEQKVSFIDFVRNGDMVKLYRESDIFVLPSLYEGVPRTILEAMACGVPVVCTDLPHLKSLVEKCGLTVSAQNHQALADKVSIILRDDGLREFMSLNGRAKIQNNYSWSDTVAKTIELYEQVLYAENEFHRPDVKNAEASAVTFN